jgi:hypothetical protein
MEGSAELVEDAVVLFVAWDACELAEGVPAAASGKEGERCAASSEPTTEGAADACPSTEGGAEEGGDAAVGGVTYADGGGGGPEGGVVDVVWTRPILVCG